jgi:hypothetical protein
MSGPLVVRVALKDMPSVTLPPTYIGYCCREWVLAAGHKGRCGLCGEIPTYLRPDEESPR